MISGAPAPSRARASLGAVFAAAMIAAACASSRPVDVRPAGSPLLEVAFSNGLFVRGHRPEPAWDLTIYENGHVERRAGSCDTPAVLRQLSASELQTLHGLMDQAETTRPYVGTCMQVDQSWELYLFADKKIKLCGTGQAETSESRALFALRRQIRSWYPPSKIRLCP